MKKLAIMILILQGAGTACAMSPIDSESEASAVASVAQATARQNVMMAESSALESPGIDGMIQTVVNSTFAFTSVYNHRAQNQSESVLLAQRIESTSIVGKEGAVAKLETTAWVGEKNKYDAKRWTIYDCADAGWRSGDFYITSKYGQGGAENMLRAYNFTNGKYAFSYTAEPVTAEIYVPNAMIKRHIAYVSRKGADSACRKNELTRNGIGALTLSDGVMQTDRIVLESASEDLTRTPVVALVDKKESKGAAKLMIWGPAEFASSSDVVKGFSVKLTFVDGTEATIPVSNDKFELDRAALPGSIKLRRVDVEKDAGK